MATQCAQNTETENTKVKKCGFYVKKWNITSVPYSLTIFDVNYAGAFVS